MNFKKTATSVITLFILFFHIPAIAQASGKIMFVPTTTSESLLFINIETGELVSVAALDQLCYTVSIDEEKGIFYAITNNYMYKGELKSGNILDKYQFMELIEKTNNDYTDPNMSIIPKGVTTSGYAIIEFNPRKLESLRNTKKYSDKIISISQQPTSEEKLDALNEINAAIGENSKTLEKESKIQELYLIDFNKKSKTHYATYNSDEVLFFGFGDNAITYNISQKELTYKDALSGEVKKAISYSGFFAKHPELAQLKIWYAPSPVGNNNVTKCGFIDGVNSKYIRMTFDSKTNEILNREDIAFKDLIYSSSGSLTYANPEMNGTYYAETECNIPRQPEMPVFPKMKGTSAKKMAAWQEEINKIQEEHKKKMEEWSKQIKQRENFCSLSVYKDKEMTQKLITIPKAEKGTIIDNDKILITRANEVVLYNLNTGATVWTVDTNF